MGLLGGHLTADDVHDMCSPDEEDDRTAAAAAAANDPTAPTGRTHHAAAAAPPTAPTAPAHSCLFTSVLPCPDVYIALQDVQFMAEHTRREQYTIRVRTTATDRYYAPANVLCFLNQLN